jgi:hypothetical protein
LQKLGHRFGDDGAFWISYKDLLRKYQSFDRTRLFGPEWKITSMWTTLNVPWALEYHDTKFSFTLARPGPVVIVLSQLDDRYFRGLEGEYAFALGFRLHKAGDEEYLVRAQTTYRMTRSCNVELELEAGEYTVLIKIDATRRKGIMPPEDVVRQNAPLRREKLLRVGLSYDLAHSKARVVETPEEKAARKAYEKRQREKRREVLRKELMRERQMKDYKQRKSLKYRRKEFLFRKNFEKKLAEKQEARRRAAEEEENRLEAAARQAEMEPGAAQDGQPSRGPFFDSQTQPAQEIQPTIPAAAEASTADESQQKPEGKPEAISSVSQKDQSQPAPEDGKEQTKFEAVESDGNTDAEKLIPAATPREASAMEPSNAEQPPNEGNGLVKDAKDDPAEPRSAPVEKHASETEKKQFEDQVDTSSSEGPAGKQESVPAKAESQKAHEETSDSTTKPPAVIAEDAGKLLQEDAIKGGQIPMESGSNAGDSQKIPIPKPLSQVPAPEELTRELRTEIDAVSALREELEGLFRVGRSGPHVGGSLPRQIHEHHHDHRHDHRHMDMPPRRDPSPSDVEDRLSLCSFPSVSEISETDLNYILEEQEEMEAKREESPSRPGSPSMDEPESGPWNAVAVVGLRIYYKVAEDDKDVEGLVKLRVIRPNYYELSDDAEGSDVEGSGDEKGDGKKGEDKKEEGEKEEKEEADQTKVLDVDDSALDATLATPKVEHLGGESASA